MPQPTPTKYALKKRIAFWRRAYEASEERGRAHRKEIAELKTQAEWNAITINEQRITNKMMDANYRRAFREMFAEETKKIMEARRQGIARHEL
jgi:hypothetical protein